MAVVLIEKMLEPGSSVVSSPMKLPWENYEAAWFLEENEDEDFKWVAYQGTEPESCVISDDGWNDSTVIRLIFINNALFCKRALVFVR